MRRVVALLAAVGLVAAACSGAQAREASPAREGALGIRLVARANAPVYVTAPRSEPGRLYVVEQAGVIRVLDKGKFLATPLLDIRSRVRSGGEQGLLSVAFHPDYATNHRFYVDYTDLNGDTRVIEYRSQGTRAIASSARQLLYVKQPFANHNGGQLEFGPDGLLYVGMGDGGSAGDPGNRAQNLSNPLGKLLRLDVDRSGARWRTIGYGLRNPWRFSFDRETGDLYIADVGQGNWEEIDYRPRGAGLANYGWRVFEGRARYTPGQQPVRKGTLVGPITVYSHAGGNCSVTGGYVYRGSAIPAFRGRYIYGDYCSGRIWSLRVVRGRATTVRQEPFSVPSLSSFGENAAGELYAVSLNGPIYRITG